MNQWTWGATLLAGVLLAGACATTALAETTTPLYATTAEKCKDPSGITDGIAVFDTEIVGLEWACQARKGKLEVGGAPVNFRCNAEGTAYKATYQLTGTSSAAQLVEVGDADEKIELKLCADIDKQSATLFPSFTPWPTPSLADAKRDRATGELTEQSQDDSGRKYEWYKMTVAQGDLITVDLYSSDFTPYLLVKGQGIDAKHNLSLGAQHAILQFRAPSSGEYTVIVSTVNVGSTGSYTLLRTIH